MKNIVNSVVTVLIVLASNCVFAQGKPLVGSYPNKELSIVVPYAVGGSSDLVARVFATELAKKWKQPVVVVNKPGSGGILGSEIVHKSAADGYTALFTTTLHIQNIGLFKKLPFDPLADFTPVAQVVRSPAVLTISSELPAKNLEEFIELIRSHPKLQSFGSAGNATTSHLYGELLNKKVNLGAVHIAYKGAGPMVTDLLGGHIGYAIVDIGSIAPHVRAGSLKVLAITGTERSVHQPSTPTFKELGLAGFDAYGWLGIFLPADVPDTITERWTSEITSIVASKEYETQIHSMGMEIGTAYGENFQQLLNTDAATWLQIVKSANAALE